MKFASLNIEDTDNKIQITLSSTALANLADLLKKQSNASYSSQHRRQEASFFEKRERYKVLETVSNSEEINKALKGTAPIQTSHTQITTEYTTFYPSYKVDFFLKIFQS